MDRDGVINIDYGHVFRKEDFKFVENIFELVSYAKRLGFLVIIITNQAGIAKGLYTEKNFNDLMSWVCKQFELRNGKIDKTYYCPYHESGIIKKYKKNSIYRKPNPGMILQACEEFNIDPKKSVLVGDSFSDIEAANSSSIAKPLFFGSTSCNFAYKTVTDLLEVRRELNF